MFNYEKKKLTNMNAHNKAIVTNQCRMKINYHKLYKQFEDVYLNKKKHDLFS